MVDGGAFRVGEREFAYLVVDTAGPATLHELTSAEREVVALVCEGCSNKQIAARRATSVNTVSNQLASIFRKLGCASRFELVHLATRRRVVGP